MTFTTFSHPDSEDRVLPDPQDQPTAPNEPPDLFDPTQPIRFDDLKKPTVRAEWLIARTWTQASLADWDPVAGE